MGRREGLQDSQGRGQLIIRIMKAIATKNPRAFLLENVKGLVSCHPVALRMILGRMRAIGGSISDVGHRIVGHRKARFAPTPRTCVRRRHPQTELETERLSPHFAGPSPSHAAHSPACWTPCR